MPQVLTITDFFKRFPNDEACLDHLMKFRFGETIECQKCKKTGTFKKLAKHPAYACPTCGHHIHPMQGTIFQDTHTPLAKWFYAMYLFTTTRHGVPAKELQRQLGVSYPTAFRMAHLIRGYMTKIDGNGTLSGEVEIDETFMGGKRTGGGRKRTMANKVVVFGMLQRKGDVMTRVVPDRTQETLEPIIQENVKAGTWVDTDEHGGYARLNRLGYVHFKINHRLKQWVLGGTHTNGIEGFWSQIKRTISGTHIHVSLKYLPTYLGEFEFRYNMRKTPHLMFDRLLTAF